MTVHTPKARAALALLLAPMHLTPETFEKAVTVGAAESRTFTPGAPKSAPESMRWFRTVESLHDDLLSSGAGWRRFDPQNLPYFTHPEKNLGLIVSSGDQNTGVAYTTPSTRNPKGSAFARRVDDNGQTALFGEVDTDGTEVIVDDAWVFLYDERSGQVFVELSLPVAMLGHQVNTWQHRIIFPPFDVSAGRFAFEDESGEADDFKFTIQRR